MPKIALVTGAAGFIGSHLTEALIGEGWAVRAFDILSERHENNCLRFVPYSGKLHRICGDVREYLYVRRAAQDADVIFHLAAEVSIPYSYKYPELVVQTNVLGTLNVLRAARETGVGRVVHTSSSEVYGSAKSVPIDETHPLQGQSPYAASKIGADKLAESFHRSYGLPVATLRPFNTFGPRQSERAVIPAIIRQILSGNRVSLGNVYPTRDFTFVEDTVRAFIRAAGADGVCGQEINVGSGSEISIEALAGTIAGLMGSMAALGADNERQRPRASEVDRLCACAHKAKVLLGWKPTVAFLEGLKRTIGWFRANPDFRGNSRG